MQKYVLFFGLMLLANKSIACDICGCAASSFSLGLLPSSNHHFIGFRSNIRTFQTTHPPLFGFQDPPTEEFFSSSDLMGRWKINHRFQLMGVVPYVFNTQKTEETTRTIQGLGDVIIMGNYVFIQNTDSITKKFKQTGTFGIGAKLPTGKFDNTNVNNRNMLPGTGTIDFVASLNYSIQKGSWGYLTESSFSYKTANSFDYQFGHALGTTHLAFYRWILNENLRILPQVGLNYNHNFKDRINGKVTDESINGGTILNAQFTLAAIYKNWMISGNYFAPVYQNLGNGYVVQQLAFRFGINYFITKK